MVNGVQASQLVSQLAETGTATVGAAPGFDNHMMDAIERVDDAQQVGDEALRLLASGEQVDLHGTMVALEKADIALRTMVSVRNRVVAAYEQVMNMAI